MAIVCAALYFGQRRLWAVCPTILPKAGGINNSLHKSNIIAVILDIIAMISIAVGLMKWLALQRLQS